jgi:predicted phosphodiesterase
MRILCTADLHIGRVSSRLPREAEPAEFTARACWKRLVALAKSEKVDAVAVAGDVIDASCNYFESVGPLEAGLLELAEEGIDSFFVAGNHDFHSLPRFFDQMKIPRAHLLGRGAKWERQTLKRDGGSLHIDGWSFPDKAHAGNPLLGYKCASDGTPVLGLLHADVGQPNSSYAPCQSGELLAAGPSVWLLGHIHKTCEWRSDATLAFYPGSPQALDPGERDAHGAWLIDWPVGGVPARNHRPLSTVRYENIELKADGYDNEAGIEAALHRLLEERLAACAKEAGPLEALMCRVLLQGRTRMHSQLVRSGWPRIEDLSRTAQGITACVERVEVDTRPEFDLDLLAQGSSPPALLASLLYTLDRGEDHPLLAHAHQRLKDAFLTMPIEGDGEPGGEAEPTQHPPDIGDARSLLLRQGYKLLAQLLETKS